MAVNISLLLFYYYLLLLNYCRSYMMKTNSLLWLSRCSSQRLRWQTRGAALQTVVPGPRASSSRIRNTACFVTSAPHYVERASQHITKDSIAIRSLYHII